MSRRDSAQMRLTLRGTVHAMRCAGLAPEGGFSSWKELADVCLTHTQRLDRIAEGQGETEDVRADAADGAFHFGNFWLDLMDMDDAQHRTIDRELRRLRPGSKRR